MDVFHFLTTIVSNNHYCFLDPELSDAHLLLLQVEGLLLPLKQLSKINKKQQY